MRRTPVWVVVGAVVLTAPACDWFEDPSPNDVRVTLAGDSGDDVEILLSKQFLTGITAEGVTQVELFDADTLIRTLPWDTLISIQEEQRFFIRTVDADTVSSMARMQVLIDGVTRYDEERAVDIDQLLFVFTFNQPVTSVVEVL